MRRYKQSRSRIPEIHLNQDQQSDLQEGRLLSRDLQVNELELRQTFEDCADVIFRKLISTDMAGRQIQMLLVCVDGLVDSVHLEEAVLKVLVRERLPTTSTVTTTWVKDLLVESAVSVTQVSVLTDRQQVIDHILKGNVVVLVDGDEAVLSAGVAGWKQRSIDEPPSEPVIRGPREGFIETLRTNTALVRRRIRNPRLKMRPFVSDTHLYIVALIALQSTMVAGPPTEKLTYSYYITARYISLGDFFERIDPLIVSIWMYGMIIKEALCLFVTAICLVHLTGLSDHRLVTIPVTLLSLLCALWFFPNIAELRSFLTYTFPFEGFIVQNLIPTFILGVDSLRRAIGRPAHA